MKQIFFVVLAASLLAACNKFDSDINENPNLPSQASNTQLLANAMRSLPGLSSNPQGNLYAQHLSETMFTDISRYNVVFYNFYGLYTGPLMNIQQVLTAKAYNSNEGPIADQVAVAKILKAYFFWHATDRWGDLPYTDALKGNSDFTPVYDKQQVIYDSIFRLLDEANAMIVTGTIKNDIVYSGDMTKWKKLANTIHLLAALRLSKVDAAKASSEFNKALTAGIMTSNSDNVVYKHLADANNENYWYNVFTVLNRRWYAVSEPLVNYMKPLNDPRLPIYANKNSAGNYVGLKFGLPGDVVNTGQYVLNNISLLRDSLRLQNSPVQLVTYAEALFAKAEAAKLGWIAGGDAEAMANYNLAIDQSIRQWYGVFRPAYAFTTEISGYLAQPGVVYNAATALQQIATQKWVHLFLNGYEAWAEWRRTSFPALLPPDNNSGKPIPRREGYPTNERLNNTSNYNEAVQRQFGGADDLNGRVWWDKP
jgi:hypothetical protein